MIDKREQVKLNSRHGAKLKDLVIGAGSTIGQAYVHQKLNDTSLRIMAISRSACPLRLERYQDSGRLYWHQTDYLPENMNLLCNEFSQEIKSLENIIICNGVLHESGIQPEKKLKHLDRYAFQSLMQINALLPVQWIQSIQPHFDKKQNTMIVLFSARVGSIEDNHLGGWYSYRASKAALNMLAKSCSVELNRISANIGILLFHPGTTDTPLSKPFQRNVHSEKLFTPEFVAQKLVDILSSTEKLRPICYLDWQGNHIPY